MGRDGLRCGNSVYFDGDVHTLSYQCSPSHPIPSNPSVVVANAPLLLLMTGKLPSIEDRGQTDRVVAPTHAVLRYCRWIWLCYTARLAALARSR